MAAIHNGHFAFLLSLKPVPAAYPALLISCQILKVTIVYIPFSWSMIDEPDIVKISRAKSEWRLCRIAVIEPDVQMSFLQDGFLKQ